MKRPMSAKIKFLFGKKCTGHWQEIAPVSISLLGLCMEKWNQDTVPLNNCTTSADFSHCVENNLWNKTFCFEEQPQTPSFQMISLSGLDSGWKHWLPVTKDLFVVFKGCTDRTGRSWAELGYLCSTLKLPYSPHTSCKLHQKSTWPVRCINLKQCPIEHLIEIFRLTLKAASNDCF